jgi:hypothetical protein
MRSGIEICDMTSDLSQVRRIPDDVILIRKVQNVTNSPQSQIGWGKQIMTAAFLFYLQTGMP